MSDGVSLRALRLWEEALKKAGYEEMEIEERESFDLIQSAIDRHDMRSVRDELEQMYEIGGEFVVDATVFWDDAGHRVLFVLWGSPGETRRRA